MDENIFQKFKEKFLDEAIMLLDRLEKDLLELEKTPDDKELLESSFRAIHTIKGASSMYSFTFISDFTHVLENIYQCLRDKSMSFNKQISDLSFQSIDHLRKLLEDEQLKDIENQTRHVNLLELIKKYSIDAKREVPSSITKTPEAKQKQSWYILLKADEQIIFRGISLVNIFRELAQMGEFNVQNIPILNESESESWGITLVSDCSLMELKEVFMFIEDNCQIFKINSENIFENEIAENIDEGQKMTSILEFSNTAASKLRKNDCAPEPESFQKVNKNHLKRISVDAEKLDQLMYLVSELITVNSQLMEASKNSKYEELRPHLENVDNLSKKFRNNALEIRLVPLSDIALRFQRLIRDLSSSLGKKIEFVTEGVDTELDKNMIDMLAEPLMHIIRNCIDHGIEKPERRHEQGKTESGTIKLSASQLGNYVFIKIADDGNGIDIEKVRLKAVERGIIGTNDKPTQKEIFDFIFLPGFSTANSLTEVSGRGVGMDVVKKKLTELRGEIMVDSIPGSGTSFTLKIQQSVAIIDTLLFKVEDAHLLVPMSDIEICIQEDASYIESRSNTATIPYDNQLIYIVNLRKSLNLDGNYSGKVKMVIVKHGDSKAALLCDKIIGEHQAVLKPLGKTLKDQEYLLAASQLGDGNLAFMLDTKTLGTKNEIN